MPLGFMDQAVEKYLYDVLPARDGVLREMERLARRRHILTGDAVQLIERVPGKFDLIFIDVDKHQYPAAFHRAMPRLRRGGLLLADNTLWSGRVARKATDSATRGIQRFNRLIYSSRQLFPVIIPLRDGVAICRKL